MNSFKYHLVLFIALCSIDLMGQTPEWQWVKRAGGVSTWSPSQPGSPDDEITSMEVDQNGNVYVAGRIFSAISASIDSAAIKKMRGRQDGIIAMFDCNGELLWYKIIGGQFDDEINDIVVDQQGSVYLTGTFTAGSMVTDSAYVGDIAFRFNSQRAFVLKLDSIGELEWIHIAYENEGPGQGSSGISMDFDKYGNLYVYGYSFVDSGNFAPGHPLKWGDFLAKYNKNGAILWVQRLFPYPSPILIQNMSVDNAGSCFLVGTLKDTLNIGGTQFNPISQYGESIVLEYDSSGNYQWGHISESSLLSNGYRIEINKKLDPTEFYIVGNTSDGAKFGALTIPTSISGGPGFIAKYKNRVPVWLEHIDYQYPNGVTSVSIDNTNNVYLATEITGNKTIIGGMKANGKDGDPFVAKFSSNGDTIFTQHISTSTTGRSMALATGFNGNFYLGGSFNQQIQIPNDSAYNKGGNSDMFVARFGIENCEDTTTVDTTIGIAERIQINNQLNVYPNPNNGSFYIQLDESSNGEIKVYNTLGSLVFQERLNGQNLFQVSLPSYLVEGVYMVQLVDEDQISTNKIIVRRE